MNEKINDVYNDKYEEELLVQKINNIEDYSIAKENLEELKTYLLEASFDSFSCDDEELQRRVNKLEDIIDMQEKLIEEFLHSQPEYTSQYLGDNIKYLLKKYGLKISDLESLLDVSSGYISRTINADSKKRLSIDITWKISKIFSVNIDELLNWSFCEPSQTVKPVISFFNKLREDTVNSDIIWKNAGTTPTELTMLLYNTIIKADGTESSFYEPRGYADITSGLRLRGNIYVATVNKKPLFIVPVEDYRFEKKGVEIYIREYGYSEDDELDYNLIKICNTLDDGTMTLSVKAEELLNTIKLHEADFRISDSAKNFINTYLDPNYVEDLPFN